MDVAVGSKRGFVVETLMCEKKSRPSEPASPARALRAALCAQHDLCPFFLQAFWTLRRSFFLIEYCLEMNVLTHFLKQETLGMYLAELLWDNLLLSFL